MSRQSVILQSLLPSPIVTGLGYFLFAWLSMALTASDDRLVTIWPGSGILLAAVLGAPSRARRWHLLAGGMADMAASFACGQALGVSLGYTLAKVTEAALIGRMLTKQRIDLSLSEPASLMPFFTASVVGVAASASMASIAAFEPTPTFWLSWSATDLLGIMVITPLLTLMGRAIHDNMVPPWRRIATKILPILAAIAAVTVFTLNHAGLPLMFLPMLAVVAAVYRLGAFGAAAGVLIVGVGCDIAINLPDGQLSLVLLPHAERVLYVQCYLLCVFAIAVPIAALLGARDRLVKDISDSNRLLQMAESAAHVGHWRLDTGHRYIHCSDEVYKIYGIADRRPMTFESAIAAYHPDDREIVRTRVAHSVETGAPFEFSARIVRPDGTVRDIFSCGEVDGPTDHGVAIFGIIQDVTSQVAQERVLMSAYNEAQRAAEAAAIIAETDPLTGIANRRHIDSILQRAFSAARAHGYPLSVLMLDIDHFKRINDEYGHQTGDMVLRRVVAMIGATLRSDDTLGRYGGEEFIIVLPGAPAHVAMRIAERVRHSVEADLSEPRVTISVGVTSIGADSDEQAMIGRADSALYRAKRDGRNRVCFER